MRTRGVPPHPPPQTLTLTTDPATVFTTLCLGLILIYFFLTNLPKPIYNLLASIISTIADIMGISGPETKERIELLFGNFGTNNERQGGIVSRIWRIFSNSGFGSHPGGNGMVYDDIVGGDDETDNIGISGLLNQGNTCYQNSVLQAMASLKGWRQHLAAVVYPNEDLRLNESEFTDGVWDNDPKPVVAALLGLLEALNRNRKVFYVPFAIAGSGAGGGSGASWLYNEQQDAQEFFQKLTASVEKEVAWYWERIKGRRGLGLGDAVGFSSHGADKNKLLGDIGGEEEGEHGEKKKMNDKKQNSGRFIDASERVRRLIKPEELESPFHGLAAQRVGCLQCGYVEAIRLQSFTSLSLSLPSEYQCTLEECLVDYTHMERIDEVECEKCTLIHHQKRLTSLLSNLSTSSEQAKSIRETLSCRLEIINQAIAEDNFSSQVFDRLVIGRGQRVNVTKTKQTMLARPPKVLVLHLNRSQFDMTSGMIRKNFAGVKVPIWLDIGAVGVVIGAGAWEVDPGKPISTQPEDSIRQGGSGILYELKGLVTHYGGHHNGHYICYRKTGKKWWRISDDKVAHVPAVEVSEVRNGFMCFYEKVENEAVLEEFQKRRMLEIKAQEETEKMMTEAEELEELELELPKQARGAKNGMGANVGVGFGVGDLGLGLGKGLGSKFGSDSDVDAILRGIGVGALVRNDVVPLAMWGGEKGNTAPDGDVLENGVAIKDGVTVKEESEKKAVSDGKKKNRRRKNMQKVEANEIDGKEVGKLSMIDQETTQRSTTGLLTPQASFTEPSFKAQFETDMGVGTHQQVNKMDQVQGDEKSTEQLPSPPGSPEPGDENVAKLNGRVVTDNFSQVKKVQIQNNDMIKTPTPTGSTPGEAHILNPTAPVSQKKAGKGKKGKNRGAMNGAVVAGGDRSTPNSGASDAVLVN